MCYQLQEVYRACHCSYYQHAIDRCPSYGRPGHRVQIRIISVGYACELHSASADKQTARDSRHSDFEDGASDTDSLFSDASCASTTFTLPSDAGEDPVERLFRDLLVEPHLEHLLPQVVRLSKSPLAAKANIARFLKRFSQDLKANSETVSEFQASRYVRSCRQNIARRIVECHSVELDKQPERPQDTVSYSARETNLEEEVEEDENLDIIYDDLAEFLFQGPEFESFRNSIQGFVERSGAQRGVGLRDGFVKEENLLSFLVGKYNRAKGGRKRLWWKCVSQTFLMPRDPLKWPKTCGRQLYDDYEELRPGALESLQVFLASYSCSVMTTNMAAHVWNDTTTPLSPPSLITALMISIMIVWSIAFEADYDMFAAMLYCTVSAIFVALFTLDFKLRQQDQNAELSDAAEVPTGSSIKESYPANTLTKAGLQGFIHRFRKQGLPHHRQDLNEPGPSECSTSNAFPGDQQRHRFLLLCIPFMKWGLKLQQPDVCRIHSDRDMFKLLRKAYLEHRSGKRFKWLRRIRQLDFSQFDLYHDSLVDIKVTPSLPSTEARHEYDYEPTDTSPPIGPNLVMHLLENPDHAPVLPILVKRIPVKRKSKLQPCPIKGFSVGWGINFIEGVEGKAVFACAFIGFILCLVAAVTWTVARDDVQGGFGIGAFILAFFLFCSTKLHLLVH